MKRGFELSPGAVFEAELFLSGRELYRLNGETLLSTRSQALWGRRVIPCEFDGQQHEITVDVGFWPTPMNIIRSLGFRMRVSLDGVRVADNVFEARYGSRLSKLVDATTAAAVAFMVIALIMVLYSDNFRPTPTPDLRILNAALAERRCRSSLSEGDLSLLWPLNDAIAWRAAERTRNDAWFTESGRPVVQVVITPLHELSAECRDSAIALLDAYLANGADIDIRHAQLGFTALQEAVLAGEASTVCALLTRGANPNIPMQAGNASESPSKAAGMTARELAAYQGEQLSSETWDAVIRTLDNHAQTGNCDDSQH